MSLLSDSGTEEPGSFLIPRKPSVLGWNQRAQKEGTVPKKLFSNIIEEESKIASKRVAKVYLRLKPSSEENSTKNSFSVLNEMTLVTHAPKESVTYRNQNSGRVAHQYSFTKIFTQDVSQKELFDECVSEQVKEFILGCDGVMFAYGTTNAGKTFTIQGNGENPGIIPRSLDLLFKSIRGKEASVGRFKPEKVNLTTELDEATIAQEEKYKQRLLQWNWDKALEAAKSITSVGSEDSFQSGVSGTFREMQRTLLDESAPAEMDHEGEFIYGVWVSFAEVYNESVYDLLEPMHGKGQKRVPLRVCQDADGNVFVKDLTYIHVRTGDEAFHIMLYGKANLQVAATNMNSESSRSHCIFTIRLVRYINMENPTHARVSTFSFCDLAGAERSKKTLNIGERLKESNNINTSLHVLRRCLLAIRENQAKNEKKPIPFRDSKLTRLFQRALCGREAVSMIVNVNTSPTLYDETVNVLKFSAIARQIVLEAPIKRATKEAKRKPSRFSIIATGANPRGTLCWETASEVSEARQSTESWKDCYGQNQELLNLVDKLKEQLVIEKKKNLTLERDVRRSVTEQCSKIMNDMEAKWKGRVRSVEQRSEELSAWRLNQLEKYYLEKLEEPRKRRRESEDDEDVHFDTSDQVEKLKEEVQDLEEKCSAMQQLLTESRETVAKLTSENTALMFKMAIVKEELECCKRTAQASQQEVAGEAGVLVKELQEQLDSEKKTSAELSTSIEDLKSLLNEAREDFLLIKTEKEEAEDEVNKLQQEIAEKDAQIDECNQNLEELQLLLSQTTRAIDKLEDKVETLSKSHETCESTIATLQEEQMKLQASLKDLQQNLSATDETCEKFAVMEKRLLEAESENKNLREEMVPLKQKCEDLEKGMNQLLSKNGELEKDMNQLLSKNGELEKDMNQLLSKNGELEKDMNEMLKKYAELEKAFEEAVSNHKDCAANAEGKELEFQKLKLQVTNEVSRSSQLDKEVNCLQKDLKAMFQRNISLETELNEVKKQSGRLENKLKTALHETHSQMDVSRASQSEIEALRVKVKAYEESLQYVSVVKDEVTLRAQELERLRATKESLEESLKNRESELESFTANRNKVISSYEDLLKKAKEEIDLEKREVSRLRDALYRSTPTSKKHENAELAKLKEENEKLKADHGSLKKAYEALEKKVSVKKELHTSPESLKENVEEPQGSGVQEMKQPVSSVKKRQTRNTSAQSHSSQAPVSERKVGRKKLFSKSRTDSGDMEAIEVSSLASTSPESYIKRSLRNRKV